MANANVSTSAVSAQPKKHRADFLLAQLSTLRRIQFHPTRSYFQCRPISCGGGAHVHDQMNIITHHCPGINATSKDIAKFQYSSFNPGLAMLETLFRVVV
jgi:hypothetical protein